MLITLKRRVTKLELLKKTVGPKSFDDLVTEVEDYARRTGVSLDDAIVRFLNDVSNDDLDRFIAETEALAHLADLTCRPKSSSEPAAGASLT